MAQHRAWVVFGRAKLPDGTLRKTNIYRLAKWDGSKNDYLLSGGSWKILVRDSDGTYDPGSLLDAPKNAVLPDGTFQYPYRTVDPDSAVEVSAGKEYRERLVRSTDGSAVPGNVLPIYVSDAEETVSKDSSKTVWGRYRYYDLPSGKAVRASDEPASTREEPAKYSVRFLMADGSALSEQSLSFGDAITVPEYPAGDGYRFERWSPPVSQGDAAESDQDYRPELEALYVSVRWLSDDGKTLLKSGRLVRGSEIPESDVPVPDKRSGKKFAGWKVLSGDAPDGKILSDSEYEATYAADKSQALSEE